MISRSAGIFRQAAGIAAAVFFASLLVGVMAPAPATAGDGHTVVHCLDDNLGTVRKTLATDCKGRAVTAEEAAAVKNQRRDYIQKVLSKVPDSSMEGKSLSRLGRSEEHTSELQSLMRSSYAVFCLKKKSTHNDKPICST